MVRFPNAAGVAAPGEYLLLWQAGSAAEEQTRKVLRDLRAALTSPYPLLGEQPQADFRTGIACYPRDGDSLEALLARADRQLADEPLRPARREFTVG